MGSTQEDTEGLQLKCIKRKKTRRKMSITMHLTAWVVISDIYRKAQITLLR